MRGFDRASIGVSLLFLLSCTGRAQPPSLSVVASESRVQAVTILGNQSDARVTGAPYSAIEESVYSHRKPDGSLEDRSAITTRIYRDSQGRTRAERHVTSYIYDPAKSWLQSVYIVDAVGGIIYRLDPEKRLAIREPWDASSRALESIQALEGLPYTTGEHAAIVQVESHATTESLGIAEIEGLTVQGYRQTVAVPAETMGNDKSFNVAVETWISPELKIAVRSTRENGSVGVRKTQVTAIERSEPDPALFRVPSDYEVEDAPPPGSEVRVSVAH